MRLATLSGSNFWGVTARSRGGTGSTLFTFTTHTFTTASTVGRFGPTLSTLRSAYSGVSWASNSLYFAQGRAQGYQLFTVPVTGIYEIEAAGARGQTSAGTIPYGAIMKGRITLAQGEKLEMVVGQLPHTGSTTSGTSYAGAGGGTFVVYGGTNTPIIIAGGGAGTYSSETTASVFNGQTRRRPVFSSVGYSYSPWSDTSNTTGYGGYGYHGGGGGGLLGEGQDWSGYSGSTAATDTRGGQQFTHGASFVGGSVSNGGGNWYAIGGTYGTSNPAEGGFGGGGAGHSGNNSGGGGGGYTGGSGGQTSLGGSYLSGVGGGSYFDSSISSRSSSDGAYDGSGLGTSSLGYNTGAGYVKITKI